MIHLDSIKVFWNKREVGTLALTPEGLCAFEYSGTWLNNGVSISPFELPIKESVFIARPEPFYGGFGVFDDSLPDGWGLLIQDRYLQGRGINPQSLNLLDRLALVGTQGRGALEFHPDRSLISDADYIDFERLSRESEEILRNKKYSGEGIEEFQKRGGSPGGARPKVTVKYEGKEWLVKFPSLEDGKDIGKLEYEISILAQKSGIEMPETRLFEGKYFGVERFDRNEGEKLHVVSVAGLLRADYRLPSIDYYHIFKIASVLSHNQEDLWKIYRLMVFNYLIDNNDDHAKNFSFIYRNNEWRFSPAYDLLPSNGINGFRTTSINDSITPQKKDLIELGGKFGLKEKDLSLEYERISEIVGKGL